ncbi:thiamine phosphate synthase [Labrenzia aggregata]|uniref:Thiamine-phosphate synthase n=2 Tax=Roseibium aggregatum TaxID=187304 RepID=A0A926NVA8_9HYPH|nr:thiamine phosphate synthase [Roseibium aggregatum]
MLPPFYLIVDDPSWLARLCPVGLKFAQLRIKDKSLPDISEAIRRGLEIARRYDCILVVNDYWQQAIDAGADWVHLGQEDLDTADVPALKRAGIRIGISTHTPAELERALALEPDYVALGPIFEPRGKTVDHAPQGLDRIREWKARIPCPLVAIGGIRVEQAAEVYAAGADSICVITDVLKAADPEQRCRNWLTEAGKKP